MLRRLAVEVDRLAAVVRAVEDLGEPRGRRLGPGALRGRPGRLVSAPAQVACASPHAIVGLRDADALALGALALSLRARRTEREHLLAGREVADRAGPLLHGRLVLEHRGAELVLHEVTAADLDARELER